MKYVIFDLEWDSVFYKPEKRFVNQILQIGAVKLDEKFNVVDEYTEIVHSDICDKVTGRFTELTGITGEMIKSVISLRDAVSGFNKFSKDCEVAMTWSDSDLHTIVDNEKTFLDGTLYFDMNLYLDLQKLVQIKMKAMGYDNKNQVSLENAADFFGINTTDFMMHNALDDSRVCAVLFRKCYSQEAFCGLLRDTRLPEFRDRLLFKPQVVNNISDPVLDKTKFKFNCCDCGARLRRISKWKYRNRWFSASFRCPECGKSFSGRVFAKKTFDGVKYKQKLIQIQRKENKNEVPVMSEKM